LNPDSWVGVSERWEAGDGVGKTTAQRENNWRRIKDRGLREGGDDASSKRKKFQLLPRGTFPGRVEKKGKADM